MLVCNFTVCVVGETKSTKMCLVGRAASIFGIKNPYAIFGSETSKALRGLFGEAVAYVGH